MDPVLQHMNALSSSDYICAHKLTQGVKYPITNIEFDATTNYGRKTQIHIEFPIPKTNMVEKRIVNMPAAYLSDGIRGKLLVIFYQNKPPCTLRLVGMKSYAGNEYGDYAVENI